MRSKKLIAASALVGVFLVTAGVQAAGDVSVRSAGKIFLRGVQVIVTESLLVTKNLQVNGKLTVHGKVSLPRQSITGAMIKNGTIGNGDISDTARIAPSKIAAGTFSGSETFNASGTGLTVTNNALVGGNLSTGSITIGDGTAIMKHLSTTKTNLVTGNILGAACGTLGTITVTGADVGDAVTVSPSAMVSGIETTNLSWSAAVTAADTVSIRACNPTAVAIDVLDTQTWRADVWR